MKKSFLLFLLCLVQICVYAQGEYYPEGTKWTEIRLDTLKYDNWYSKVNGEWVPNFETIEYRVEGEYTNQINGVYNCVYTNGPEWADSLTLLIREVMNTVEVTIPDYDNQGFVMGPATTYQFDWNIGQSLSFQTIAGADATCFPPCGWYNYGLIEEVKEGNFGGVRPLKYVDLNGKAPVDPEEPWYMDTNGGRIIQGIGVTEWNDGECLFGPPNPYLVMTGSSGERHYRSMLVHFERDGEVLYDVWPEKPVATEPVAFTAGQMATIVLPTEPDAGKGKYYRLDRIDGNEIVFEQELHPQAHVPYIIVPNEDFSIEISTLELAGLRSDTVSVEGISFIGTYQKEVIEEPDGFYIDIIDTTPDCSLVNDKQMIGALRAYLLVTWDDPYNHGGTKVPAEEMQIVLHDHGTGIGKVKNEELRVKNGAAAIFDLSGRKVSMVNGGWSMPKGIYIDGGRKKMK